MSNDTYLAIYLGSSTAPAMAAWNALPEAEQKKKAADGIAAWKSWMEKHRDAIVVTGGPLGKTKKTSARGIEDIVNALTGYCVIRAPSHEAAAKMFENHPHFAIFPGESVEVMPVLPIPAG